MSFRAPLIVVLLVGMAGAGCEHFSTRSTRLTPHYNLLRIDQVLTLPEDLKEISGLAYDSINCVFYAVADEKGRLYRISREGAILGSVRFGKKGDYEGLALVNDLLFILESNGDLYEVDTASFRTRDQKAVHTKYKAPWKKSEAEGLCYVPSNDLLLIAYKDFHKENSLKQIHLFDITACEFIKDSTLFIDVKEISDVLFNTSFERFSFKVNRFLALERPDQFFKPSEIAVHPFNQEIYVLNGSNNLLAIFDPTMQLRSVHPLLLPEFRQPEGISFDEAGNLYISNEARGDKANILQFKFL